MELAVLGFLAEGPLHGYELRRRVARLSGYARRVSDGTLYLAIKRMTDAGLLDRRVEPGTAAAQRAVLSPDRRRPVGAPASPRVPRSAEQDVNDPNRWMTLLAFLEQPASFFYDGDRPLRAEDVSDPYRRGMFLIARATSRTERAWLHEVLDTTP